MFCAFPNPPASFKISVVPHVPSFLWQEFSCVSIRKVFNSSRSKNQRLRRLQASNRRGMMKRLLGLEPLEDRRLLATFAEAGAVLSLEIGANEDVGIVANADTYTFTITGGTASWTGTDSPNVTGNSGAALTVTTAGQVVFNTVNITDFAANASATFNNSSGNYTDAFSITLDEVGAGGITFAGASNFTGASGTLTADTTDAITVNAAASVTQDTGTLSLTAGASVTATGADDGAADISAPTITLMAGGAGTIGSSAANRLELDATIELNAETAGGDIFITDTAGGVAVGLVTAGGGDVTLTTSDDSITESTSDAAADIVGATVNLVVNGTGKEIGDPGPVGGPSDPLEVIATTLLNASTVNGNMALSSVGSLPLGALDAGSAMILLDAAGAITDANGGIVNLTSANGVNLTTIGVGSAIGTAGNPIETAIGSLTATTNDGGIFVSDSNGPGLIINTVLAKEVGNTPYIDGSNQIVVDPSAPYHGTHDVSVTAQGPIMLNSVTAPNAVTINSLANSILDVNQALTNVLAQSVNLMASGAVGQATDPIELTVESFSASTTNGDIFLMQGIAGTAESVVAGGAGNNVSVTSTADNLRIKVITAPGNVTVRNDVGSLLYDDNGAAVNITGQIVDLTGTTGIGTAADPLKTTADELVATVSDSAAPIRIDETNELDSVAVKTNAGDVTINFTGGPLVFTASTEVLSASGAAVTFETTTGDVKLGVVDAGTGDINITVAGSITDDINDAVVDFRGGTVTLNAGTGIGALGDEIDTDVATLNATTSSGGIFGREADSLILSALTLGSDIDVRTATGDMTLGLVSAPGQVTLRAGGAILDGNADANNVSANTLDLLASSGIGSGDALETSVNTLTANGGAGGGLLLANNKSLSLTSATATGGAVSVNTSGSLTLGTVTATGQPVTLSATGELIDANGATLNISAASATLNASKIGMSGDKIETDAAAITAATTTGGIFVSNSSASLELTATALGAAADIDIDSAGSIVLNTATAQGDTVKLRATGSITDGNDPPPSTVNITAKKLDIAAPGGIGTPANPLEVDVDQILTSDGGAGGANVTNIGPLLLTEAALEASGSGTLTFDAESITIENIDDNTATIASDRSLVLRTQTGDIVFLDAADTIQTQGTGTITIHAGMIAGSGGVAVLGNLKTADGDIMVNADGHITIGLLDAGTGDVILQSLAGIIIDGNGTTLNVIAGTTTLSGAAPTAREAELDETFKIAEAAAASGEADAKLTSAEAFHSGSEIVAAAKTQADAAVIAATGEVSSKQNDFDPLDTASSNLALSIEISRGVTVGTSTAKSIAAAVSGAAQAVPVTGDGGAATAAAVLVVAHEVANGALQGQLIAKGVVDGQKSTAQTALLEAKAKLAAANSTKILATQTKNAFDESFSIADAAAQKAVIVRDASERVRDQSVLARDQANVIGTFSAPLGIQVAGVINVTAGPTDSYLQVVGPTAVDLIQTTGSVTLISTGAISDADAGVGTDITALGLTTIAVGGIGTAADPLETRVATLNATNTASGDIAIDNTAGTPAALDITGISNMGGGDVIISSQGNTAAGQGITVSGPISATGVDAEVTISSGSPLVVGADVMSAGAIVLTATETAVAGDDLTVNSGVTIESTGSSVTLRAGDNITVSFGSTIQANTSITITADFNDDAADTTGANVIVAGTLIAPMASIGVDAAADDDDTFTITPSVDTPITVDAEDGSDRLNFTADGLPVTIFGNQITAAGRQPVTFNNFEFVNITNAAGGGSVTLLTAAGDADVMILTGTGQHAGTFTLNGGIPISFSGVDSFTFNAGDMDDQSTVSPFATALLPWMVAVTIDGGDGTDRITYNNVAGLIDTTSVTATAPQAGHIDSPGITSAFNSQVVSFTNVEDITANANLGENEKLTVNLRDTGAADAAIVRFDPVPGGHDIQLFGLFDLIVDTDNYTVLTLNGNGGDDTFVVAPGPIPVVVDGDDPNASDRLIVEDQGIGNTVRLHQGTDERSGTVHVGSLPPVWYSGIEFVDILPLDPVTGGAGNDGHGRIVVFQPDTFEFNNSRLNPTEISDLFEHTTKPNISPGGETDPYGLGFDLPGDEDWYRFTATETGTFQFEVVHDPVPTLPNGEPGLPGDGQLRIDIYEANGTPIVRLPTSTDPAVQSIGVEQGNSYMLRIHGETPEAINIYDIKVVDGDTLGPQVVDPDGAGPEQAIQINGNPTFNLFDVKPAQGPTPLLNSLVIHIQDEPLRFSGFLYGALDESVASNLGHYQLVGDHNGIITIAEISVVNGPVIAGEAATATITIDFADPLPDDRYTLTLSDSISDPSGNLLDGESNANEPNSGPDFPSGDGISGGDFVARFTVDSRPEVAVWSQGVVYVDINGNMVWDPEGQDNDATNRDFVYNFGSSTDAYFAGNFAPVGALTASGYDKLGAYGAFNGMYQFFLDTNDNGVGDTVGTMAFNVNAIPVAGDFNAAHPGDEIGAYDGSYWYLDVNGNNSIDAGERFPAATRGVPLVGDFNGDGTDDLATYNNDTGEFLFTLVSVYGVAGPTVAGPIDVVTFGFSGFGEKPVAGDVNLDGVDDIVMWVPGREGQLPKNAGEFHFLVSDVLPSAPIPATTLPSTVFSPFSPAPLGNDLIAQFGDDLALPIMGNFDPPLNDGSSAIDPVGSLSNLANPLDTNVDGVVTANDALVVLNALSRGIDRIDQPLRTVASLGGMLLDSSMDGAITPLDALRVINHLSRQSGLEAESERSDETPVFNAWLSAADAVLDDDDDEDLFALLAGDQVLGVM